MFVRYITFVLPKLVRRSMSVNLEGQEGGSSALIGVVSAMAP